MPKDIIKIEKDIRYDVRQTLIALLQKYNQLLYTKHDEESTMRTEGIKLGIGRIQPTLIATIIRFSGRGNEEKANEWHEYASNQFHTHFQINGTTNNYLHRITCHRAQHYHCEFIVQHTFDSENPGF